MRTRLEVYPTSQPPALGLGTSASIVSTTLAQLADLTIPSSGSDAGNPQITVNGMNGLSILLEYSYDLILWLPLTTSTLTGIGVQFTDTGATGISRRFHRLRLP